MIIVYMQSLDNAVHIHIADCTVASSGALLEQTS